MLFSSFSASCKGIQKVAFPSLRSLNRKIEFPRDKVLSCNTSLSFLGLSRCTRLVELELGPVDFLSSSQQQELFGSLPKLTNLQILHVYAAKAPTAMRSFYEAISAPMLTKLEILCSETADENLNVPDGAEILRRIERQSPLRDLRLLRCSAFSENISQVSFMSSIAQLHNLEFLSLPPQISEWEMCSRLTNLTQLVVGDFSSAQCIRYCSLYTNITAMELECLRQTIPKLEVVKANVITRFLSPHNGAESFWTFIGAAARPKSPQILEYMLSMSSKVRSFDINAADLGGYTPIMNVRSLETCKFLIANGANVNALTNGLFPRDNLVQISCVLSELAVNHLRNYPISILDGQFMANAILSQTDADLTIGSPPVYILAISTKSPVLRIFLSARPKFLSEQPYEFIMRCRMECKDVDTWNRLKKTIPEATLARIEEEYKASH
jgi:hypothetical protein